MKKTKLLNCIQTRANLLLLAEEAGDPGNPGGNRPLVEVVRED